MFHMQRHARFYSTEICLALNYLHEPGIIYRDLKLDIVLLDHEGHVKLTEYEMYASAPATLDYASASTYSWLTLARKLNDSIDNSLWSGHCYYGNTIQDVTVSGQ